jgi:hypothetical protein
MVDIPSTSNELEVVTKERKLRFYLFIANFIERKGKRVRKHLRESGGLCQVAQNH